MAENEEPLSNQAPITYLVRTIKGVRRNLIYYDPDVFHDTIILSASLLIGDDIEPFQYHYNTSHDEDKGISGTEFQDIIDIAIPVYPIPNKPNIIGSVRMKEGSVLDYFIDLSYDTENKYTYEWSIVSDVANIVSTNNRNVTLEFTDTGVTELIVTVTNEFGCTRTNSKFLYSGVLTRKMLVVRNSYY